jgi:YbgC/YbaW family acyl-CoA thioester hydrolase
MNTPLSSYQPHEYKTLIREHHLDSFGHVNNAQYLMLFEEARWEMITSRGYGLKNVQETKIGTVVLECNVRFKRELSLRESITIVTRVESVSKKIVKLNHLILKANGEVAAEAVFTMGCFDLIQRKLITPVSGWLKAITGV